jgi:hypothetical protein
MSRAAVVRGDRLGDGFGRRSTRSAAQEPCDSKQEGEENVCSPSEQKLGKGGSVSRATEVRAVGQEVAFQCFAAAEWLAVGPLAI